MTPESMLENSWCYIRNIGFCLLMSILVWGCSYTISLMGTEPWINVYIWLITVNPPCFNIGTTEPCADWECGHILLYTVKRWFYCLVSANPSCFEFTQIPFLYILSLNSWTLFNRKYNVLNYDHVYLSLTIFSHFSCFRWVSILRWNWSGSGLMSICTFKVHITIIVFVIIKIVILWTICP